MVPVTRALRKKSRTFNNDLCNVGDKPLKKLARTRKGRGPYNTRGTNAAIRPRNTTQAPVYTRLSSSKNACGYRHETCTLTAGQKRTEKESLGGVTAPTRQC